MATHAMPPPNYENRSSGIIILASVALAVSTVAVALRFWARKTASSLILWWDDWSMLATLAVSHGFLIINIYWTTIGLGKHSWMIPLDDIISNNLTSRAALVLYAVVICFVKVSALLLYARIFKLSKHFIVILWVVGSIVTAWMIITAIVPWFFCHPIEKDINPFLPGTCDTATAWYLASAFLNAFFDLVVLVLPLPVIWRLQMTPRKKILITLVFLLGYCSAFLSFARFIIIVRNPDMLSAGGPTSDPSWDLVPILYLSMLEGPFAILALCAPSINQLINRSMEHGSLRSLFSVFSTTRRDTTAKSGGSSKNSRITAKSGFSQLDNSSADVTWPRKAWQSTDATSTTAFAERQPSEDGDWKQMDVPLNSVKVRHDVTVV